MQVNVPNTVEAILADARNELQEGAHAIKAADDAKKVVVVEELKVEAAPEVKEPAETREDPDDLEGDDGLTPRQKREYTASMLKSLGKKHQKQLSAEAFATQQYNERKLADDRAARAERELSDLRSRVMPPATDAKPAESEKPKRESYKTQEEYDDALVDYKVDTRLRLRAAEEAKAADVARMAEINRVAEERVAASRALVPDFDEKISAVDIPIPPHIGIYMQESELLGELSYHFSEHPDELENLRKLTIGKSLVEIGKIAGRLQPFSERFKPKGEKQPEKAADGAEPSSKPNGADKKPSPTQTGQAPSPTKPRVGAPIKPIAAGSAPQVEKDPADMSAPETIEAWQRTNNVDFTRRRRH